MPCIYGIPENEYRHCHICSAICDERPQKTKEETSGHYYTVEFNVKKQDEQASSEEFFNDAPFKRVVSIENWGDALELEASNDRFVVKPANGVEIKAIEIAPDGQRFIIGKQEKQRHD